MTDPEKVAALARTLGVNLDEEYKPHDVDEAEPRAYYNEQGQLIYLNLNELNLTTLPDSVGEFEHLRELHLAGNKLTELPNCLYRLSTIQVLILGSFVNRNNKLIRLGNQIYQLPSWLAQLDQLQELSLANNQLIAIPSEIGQLTQLQILYLSGNQLTTLPNEIGQLTQLRYFHISRNQLTSLPSQFSQLIQLTHLYLYVNQLTALPPEIGNLVELKYIYFRNNQIRHLPKELGNLTQLKIIALDGNPLKTPPPEVVEQGTESVLEFLRALQVGSKMRYESKLLLVGNGRAGKTSLVEALLGHAFDPQRDSTHGVEIKELELPVGVGLVPTLTMTSSDMGAGTSPAPTGNMTLHAWDFGGQQIYHTTHQFFLSERSLYLVVWNGGADTKEAGIERWLENIKVLAPDSPILLVATHADQRQPDINFQALQTRYPQLRGHFAVSNATGAGIDALKQALAAESAQLPLMEQEWPS